MRLRDSATVSMFAVLVLGAATAFADVPSAEWSVVDPCLVFCPAGDDTFHVLVRKILGRPYAQPIVVIDYNDCSNLRVCPPLGDEPYIHQEQNHVIRMTGDNQGNTHLPVRAGGGCAANTIRIYADGVQLATRAFASPDQSGDGVVDGRDLTLLQLRIGSPDPSADLDCDGVVTPADASILLAHSGHSCGGGATSSPAPSWGRVKQIYRSPR